MTCARVGAECVSSPWAHWSSYSPRPRSDSGRPSKRLRAEASEDTGQEASSVAADLEYPQRARQRSIIESPASANHAVSEELRLPDGDYGTTVVIDSGEQLGHSSSTMSLVNGVRG